MTWIYDVDHNLINLALAYAVIVEDANKTVVARIYNNDYCLGEFNTLEAAKKYHSMLGTRLNVCTVSS